MMTLAWPSHWLIDDVDARSQQIYCRAVAYNGSGSRWDAHSSLEANHSENCKSSDKPIAGLLTDLKARGMLKGTLVVWGGEFGRTPLRPR
jgi:hypothetical protein